MMIILLQIINLSDHGNHGKLYTTFGTEDMI